MNEPLDEFGEISIREAKVEAIRPLRHAVLRAGLPLMAAVFDGDDEPATRHVAAFDRSGEVVGCATIVQRPWKGDPAWQLRGMAIHDRTRGGGIGRQLLIKIDEMVIATSYSRQLWCNARTPAVGFYLKQGWVVIGEQFHIETAGPHYQMIKSL